MVIAINKYTPLGVALKTRSPHPLSTKCSHWLNPPCPCEHTINFKTEVFCTQKYGRPQLKTTPPPLSALDNTPCCRSFYEQPFTIIWKGILKRNFCVVSEFFYIFKIVSTIKQPPQNF